MDKKIGETDMKTKRIIVLIAVMYLCLSVFAQINKSINITQSQIKFTKDISNVYDRLSWGEGYYTDSIGLPELPVYVKSFLIPMDAQLNGVIVSGLNKQKMQGTYFINPVQPQIPTSIDDSISNSGLPDPAIYNSSTPYPGKQAEIISDDNYLGYRIVTVRLYPFEYKPAARELYICNFDFTNYNY